VNQFHVFFTKPDSGDEIFEGYRGHWTVPGDAHEDDYALIYVAEQMEIVALARLTAPPFRDETNRFGWGLRAWWAKIAIVAMLKRPVPLAAIKEAAEVRGWKAWKSLRGRRHVIVPPKHRRWVSRFLAGYDSAAGRLLVASGTDDKGLPDAGADKPTRGSWTVERVIRDTRVGRILKGEYDGTCQVCRRQLIVAPGKFYAEAHHLRPLGKPHDGPDRLSNVLVLCSAHHVEFDHSLIAPDPRGLRLHTVHSAHPYQGKVLHVQARHSLDRRHLKYHWRLFQLAAKRFKSVERTHR
jgi:HNH endonuclease